MDISFRASPQASDYGCVLKPAHGGGWVCIYPELPGCMAQAATKLDALVAGEAAAERWLERAPIFEIVPAIPEKFSKAANDANRALLPKKDPP